MSVRRLLAVVLLGAIVGIARPSSAQSAELQRQLTAARDTAWRAQITNDTAALRRFLPPAAVGVEGATDVRWSDRRQIIAQSDRLARSNAKLLDLSFPNTRIAPLGQDALVQSEFRTIVAINGRVDTTHGRATELFVRRGRSWVIPYRQLETIANPWNGGREILLPDTLGANFSIADSAQRMGTIADYDALLGSWEYRFQNRRPDGTFGPAFTGHWTFDKKPGGGLIEDRWRPDDPSISMGISLYSYRTFDPQRNVWNLLGTSSNGGAVQPGLTWSQGKDILVVQRARGVLVRIRYLSIEDAHFLWRSDRSYDNGVTWIRDFGIMEARRIGK